MHQRHVSRATDPPQAITAWRRIARLQEKIVANLSLNVAGGEYGNVFRVIYRTDLREMPNTIRSRLAVKMAASPHGQVRRRERGMKRRAVSCFDALTLPPRRTAMAIGY